jgi:integrase
VVGGPDQVRRLRNPSGGEAPPLSPSVGVDVGDPRLSRLIANLAHRRQRTGEYDELAGTPAQLDRLGVRVFTPPWIVLRPKRQCLTPASIAAGLKIEETVVGKNGKEKIKVRPTVTFHTFRHTCASLLFDDGRNIKQVQEWLGHADPGFTLRTYVHLLDAGVGGGLEFPGS